MKEVERAKRPDLESWREGFEGGRIGGRDQGGEKGVEKGGKGLEGEDFPGKFRETPRPPDPTRTSFAKNQRPPPVRGRSLPSSPTLLTPICVYFDYFSI